MVNWKSGGPKPCDSLLQTFRHQQVKPYDASKLRFTGVGDRDVYNITAPFIDQGEQVIVGRVEHRDSEQSEVYFFVERNGVWEPRKDAPVFTLQDPFYTKINGELIFGGVETFPHPQHEGKLSWRTVFYKGTDINGLEMFFKGPDQMKDLRLVQLKDGKIGVFTRPQGEKGGRGKIGFATIPSLDDLSLDLIAEAPLFPNQFLDEEWGGSNEIHLLSNGLLGVLGHIAKFDSSGKRHYYPMIFVVDPNTKSFTEMEIIAERSSFPEGPAKRDDLIDVVFSGGLIRNCDGTARLYAGISDAEAHTVVLRDPFLSYEKE